MKAYYPKKLPPKNIKEDSYNQIIRDCYLELGRFDGMLRHNSSQKFVKPFLRTEEVLTSASLEVRDLEFNQYFKELLDKGYESDDMVEMKFMVNYYKKADKK